jgi:hypothetical protein
MQFMKSSTPQRTILYLAFSIPGITLLLAYFSICYFADSFWPWQIMIHESGERTLLNTVLYYEHAARELPLDLILGVAIGASALFALPHQSSPPSRWMGLRRSHLLAVASAIVTASITGGTIVGEGAAVLWENLLQMHTRPGEQLDWGAHWRFHLLSRLSLMLASLGFAGWIIWHLKGTKGRGSQSALKYFGYVLATFVALTALFRPNPDPFLDAIFLGHQTREVFTHLLVTLPLGWAVCLSLAGTDGKAGSGTGTGARLALQAGLIGCTLWVYLFLASIHSDSITHSQTGNFILLISPHFFEHVFSYLLVPLVAGLTWQVVADREYADVDRSQKPD